MVINTTEETTGPVDFQHHVRDYTRVMAMLKWGAVGAFILAMLVMILLAS